MSASSLILKLPMQLAASAALLLAVPLFAPAAQAQDSKPNILFIMGDDIGFMQPSIYHRGLAVGETPNIDRIGNDGAIFMTYYAEQSCTAGRNAFFTGMHPLRTGMIPPQLPGSPSYLRPGTPALAFPSPQHPWGVQNAFVQAMSDLGIVGLITFLGLLVTALAVTARAALRAPPETAVTALVALVWLVVVMGVLSALGLVAGIPTDALLWLSLGFCVYAVRRSRDAHA